jgi:hypothetical protein
MRTRLFATILTFCAFALPALAQSVGEIGGEVRDTTGAAIAGVAVRAVNVETNVARTTTTNSSGAYDFPGLNPGKYSVKAEKQGFKTVVNTNIALQVQQSARIDMEMAVGSISESVEVNASAALLTTEDATVGTVIETKRIVELPLNGRNYLQLVALAPNVSAGFGNAGQAQSRQGGDRSTQNIAVGGNRAYYTQFSLDGVENTDPNFNTYVILPSIDALQEFKVQTGVYPAEFGREATQINVSTRSGTNQYHGAAFEFLRNDKLDAANYAFTAKKVTKNPFKQNQFGGTFGGPVWIPKLFNGHNRLFFLGNYESYRLRQSNQATYSLPQLANYTGNFSNLLSGGTTIYDPATRVTDASGKLVSVQAFPGNIIPQSRINPISAKFLNFYRTPNLTPPPGVATNYQQSQGAPRNKDQFILRMDFTESSKSQWFGRYSWNDENQLNQGLNLNGSSVLTNVEQYVGSNVRVFSSTIVNEARFGYNRFFNSSGRELAFKRDVVSELAIPGLPKGTPVTYGIPNISIGKYSGFGDDSEGPYANDNNSLQFVDSLSVVRGLHSFKFGGEFRRDHYNQVGNQFARGQFTFDSSATQNVAGVGGDEFADFLLGQVKRSEVAVAIASAKFLQNSFSLYVDDTWKLRPNLTIALGLRYERTPPFTDTTGRLITVGIPADIFASGNVQDPKLHPYFERQGSGAFYEGIDNLRWPNIQTRRDGVLGNTLVQTDNFNFAPRVGITFSPTPKWVVRSGFGIFYSQDTGNPRFDLARNLAGRTRFESDSTTLYNFQTAFASLGGAVSNVGLPTAGPYAFANLYDRKTPRTMTYLLNIQRELPGNTLLEFGYLGSVSHHLESLRAVNEAIPGTTSLATRIPFPEFGRIQLVDASSNANYNGASVKITKRYTNGLTYLAAYTYSKSIDDASSIRTNDGDTLFPQNSRCLRCERALSIFNVKNRFVTSLLYELPIGKGRKFEVHNRFLNAAIGGWQVGTIFTYQTGFPITITDGGRDISVTGGGFDRPNSTGVSPELPNELQTTNHFLNNCIPSTATAPARNCGLDGKTSPSYVVQAAGTFGNVGRNTLIGPRIFNFDSSLIKDFHVTESQYLQFRWESFNSTNHPNWGNPDTNILSGNFGVITGTRTSMRQQQFALKYIF